MLTLKTTDLGSTNSAPLDCDSALAQQSQTSLPIISDT